MRKVIAGIFLLGFLLLSFSSRAQLAVEKLISSGAGAVRAQQVFMQSYSDRGFVIANTEGDFLVIKSFDDSANLVWSRKETNIPVSYISSFDINSQDEALVSGFMRSQVSGDYTGFMVKVSHSGQVLWQKEFSPKGDYGGIYGAYYTSKGDIMAFGFSSPIGGGEPQHFFLKTDKNGNYISSTNLYNCGIWGQATAGMNNELYIFADDAVVKVNENGQIIWTMAMYDPVFEHTLSMTVGDDNYLYLIQSSQSSNALVKVHPSGYPVWRKELHTGGGTPRIRFLNDSISIIHFNRIYRLSQDGEYIRGMQYSADYGLADMSPACGGQYYVSGVSNGNKSLVMKTMQDLSTGCSVPASPAAPDKLTIFAGTQSRNSTTTSFNSVNILFDMATVTPAIDTYCQVIRPYKINLGPDTLVCNNGEFELDAGVSPATYQWSTGDDIQKIKVKAPGWYWVIAKSECFGTVSDSIFISFYPLPLVKFTVEPNVIEPGDTITAIDLTKDIIDRWWLLGDTLISKNTQAKFTTDRNGIFPIVLQVKDSYNCITKWPSYFRSELFRAYVPSAFTPNGDGLNDIFSAGGFGIKSSRILIYNRWGQCIADVQNGWDGYFDGRLADTGVYFYKIELTSDFDKFTSRYGTVHLLR